MVSSGEETDAWPLIPWNTSWSFRECGRCTESGLTTGPDIAGNDELEFCHAKLEIGSRRARIPRASIATAAVSVLLVAVLVIPLFCGSLLPVGIARVIVALCVGCMCSLIGALASFIRDVNQSLQALWLDFPVGRREIGRSSLIRSGCGRTDGLGHLATCGDGEHRRRADTPATCARGRCDRPFANAR